jgi:flagellar basal-body rod protein FlgF
METTSYIALSRQGALRREMDLIGHNLANMNTGAFKGAKMMFVEHLVQSRNDTSFLPTKLAFARDVAQYKDFSEGQIRETGDTFHMALRGDGYFVVEMEDGTQRYTRNGNFTQNQQGQLVTQSGQPVLSTGGAPIFFSPQDTKVTVAADGTISTNNGPLGQVKVVRFEDQQQLEYEAGGLWTSEAAPQDVAQPRVIQGALESSNISPVLEISHMIEVQRAYEGVKSFIDAEDNRQKKMIDQLSARV